MAKEKETTEKKEVAESAKVEKESSPAFDCLAVTQVSVWPFKEGPAMGHMKGLAQVVLNDQMLIRGHLSIERSLVAELLTGQSFVVVTIDIADVTPQA